MSRKDLTQTIATTFLSGAGLKVAQRVAEEMLTAAMTAKDMDAVEALSKVRGDLRKLAEGGK